MFISLSLAFYAWYQTFYLHLSPKSTFANKNSFAAYLNLLTLVVSGLFLTLPGERRRRHLLFAALLFSFFFTVNLIGSRGAFLGFYCGVAFLCLVAWRQSVSAKRIVLLLGVFLLAFLAANTFHQGYSAARIATLAEPMTADSQRFVIWESVWRMWQQTPWYGIGFGTLWFGWQPFRYPTESSAGFFAHNDYLQVLVEAGLPGLVLLLGLLVSGAMVFVRAVRSHLITRAHKIELTGGFCGFAAVAIHTFFTFNFYILPIMMLCGLVIGRCYFLAAPSFTRPPLVLHPERLFRPSVYRTIVVLLALIPLTYFAGVGISYYQYTRGITEMTRGDFVSADRTLQRAARLWGSTDILSFTRADLYRQALQRLPGDQMEERTALFGQALKLLADGEAKNALRPKLHVIRGLLLEQNPDLAGGGWEAASAGAYQRALEVDPRFLEARVRYALLLEKTAGEEIAERLLEDGAAYYYHPKSSFLEAFYALLVQVREKKGDLEGMRQIQARLDKLRPS